MIFYIYVIRNTRDGKRYVGCSVTPQKRILGHLRSTKYSAGALARAVVEEGASVFTHEIIAQAETREEAQKVEQSFIEKYETLNPDYGYNSRCADIIYGVGIKRERRV